jgi:hypothetical protein
MGIKAALYIYVSSEVLAALTMKISLLSSGMWNRVVLCKLIDVLEKHASSIFRAELYRDLNLLLYLKMEAALSCETGKCLPEYWCHISQDISLNKGV